MEKKKGYLMATVCLFAGKVNLRPGSCIPHNDSLLREGRRTRPRRMFGDTLGLPNNLRLTAMASVRYGCFGLKSRARSGNPAFRSMGSISGYMI
jgi:hypothetical protein